MIEEDINDLKDELAILKSQLQCLIKRMSFNVKGHYKECFRQKILLSYLEKRTSEIDADYLTEEDLLILKEREKWSQHRKRYLNKIDKELLRKPTHCYKILDRHCDCGWTQMKELLEQ